MAGAALGALEAVSGPVPRWLRLRELADGAPAAAWSLPLAAPPWDELGRALETALAGADRRRRGAHFTPRWLADGLARLAVTRAGSKVEDPACGAGAFLLAALDRLVGLGTDPAVALGRVRGTDLDPLSVAVTEACLWSWARHHGLEPDGPSGLGELSVGDALLEGPGPGGPVDAVIGNPPFLGQLSRDTVRSRERTGRLRERFGDAVAAYTDESALFLLDGLDRVRDGGAVVLLQPRSVLAGRDGRRVRERVLERGHLAGLWLDDAPVFGAGVRVCAPVLRRREHHAGRGAAEIRRGAGFSVAGRAAPAGAGSWAPLAEVGGEGAAPAVALGADRTVGDLARVTAGFRDEYYGLVPAVCEAEPGDPRPRLVTSGSIDLADLRWGAGPSRFARRRWDRPVLELGAVADQRVARWVSDRLVAKVLVATQTAVLECVVDARGDLVPSVPVLSVEPADPDDLWRLAAVLAAPGTTAWLRRRTAGTARSVRGIKPAAGDLRAVPFPAAIPAAAVSALRSAHAAETAGERRGHLLELAALMAPVQGVGPEVLEWWAGRLRVR